MLGTALGDVFEEVDESLLLLRTVVREEANELARVRLDEAEQVLQPGVRIAAVPERVSFEVEEDVTRVGGREATDRRLVENLALDVRSPVGRFRQRVLDALQGGLPAEAVERGRSDARNRAGGGRQL